MIKNKFILKILTCLILLGLLGGLVFVGGGCTDNKDSNLVNTASINSKKAGYQLEKPGKNEEIAVLKTSIGEISIRFFPEAAPKAVENFKTHVKNGYYNNLLFHRVIDNFMIQTGDPKGDGSGGESIWKKSFEDEFSDKVFNLRGSVAMANSGKNSNGSQFFINQNPKISESVKWNGFNEKLTDEIKNLYKQNGGNPTLDGFSRKDGKGHTVFAQVFEGMDVVDKIASCQKSSKNKEKPKDDIKIESIELKKF